MQVQLHPFLASQGCGIKNWHPPLHANRMGFKHPDGVTGAEDR
jgi:hypothetical protein